MSAPQVRLWGDPFCSDRASQSLRACLAEATARGWRCALSLTGAVGEASSTGRAVPLTDGVRSRTVWTLLDDDQLARVARAAGTPVAATAPLLVFGGEDDIATAGLEYAQACIVWSGLADPGRLVARLGEALRGVGSEVPPTSVEPGRLQPFAELGTADPGAPLLHVSDDVFADGTDVVLRSYGRQLAAVGELTVLLPRRDADREAELLELVGDGSAAARVRFADGTLRERLCGASAIVWPLRRLRDPQRLLQVLASGRPLVASRNRQTSAVLSVPGVCMPVGGRHVPGGWFEPDPRMIVQGVQRVFEDWDKSVAMVTRARSHVFTDHVAPRPSRPAVPVASSRPTVVLEAPLFETSSSATLTIGSALALQRRGRVDLRLVPRVPFRGDVGDLRRAAPSLVPLLSRDPGSAHLWLSSGWPPRAHRPAARCFAVRLDWEYGALPAELTPLVSQEADLIVVHSSAVRAVVSGSGRPAESIVTIPHGVDGDAFHEAVTPSAEVLRFKGERPAVLFVGGLIWRKGFDLFLKSVAEVGCRTGICAVVKPLGGTSSYFGSSMDELARRFAEIPGAPEVLMLDRELDRTELAGVYRACDLLVHPYRGEGFGLPVLEAQASGLPVLVSAGGSTDDFCDSGSAVRIPTRRHDVQLRDVCISSPHVLEPDGAALVAALDRALTELPSLSDSARANAAGVRARYTWDRAAEALERIALRIAGPGADNRLEDPKSRRPAVPTLS